MDQSMNIFDNLSRKQVAKGTVMQTPGETAQFAYRVLSGCLKSYLIDRSGKEHILQFAPEDWIISDIDSLNRQGPSDIYISALEESEVQLIPREHLFRLEEYSKEDLENMNRLLLNNMAATKGRLIAMLSYTAEERYQGFLNQYPSLANRLPQKWIAAYIGITPEYLSEIRRKATKG